MEIEEKLGISSKRKAKKIWRSLRRSKLDWIGKAERLAMKADYFDTRDRRLRENRISFRIRREGPDIVATLKGKGQAEKGLHVREEENICLNNGLSQRKEQKRFFRNPPDDLFHGTTLGDEAKRLIGGKPLRRFVSTDFIRRKQKLRFGESILEVSVDTGKIRGKSLRRAPIRELEVELMDGSPEDVRAFSNLLSVRYGLKPENRSKLERGIALGNKAVNNKNSKK